VQHELIESNEYKENQRSPDDPRQERPRVERQVAAAARRTSPPVCSAGANSHPTPIMAPDASARVWMGANLAAAALSAPGCQRPGVRQVRLDLTIARPKLQRSLEMVDGRIDSSG